MHLITPFKCMLTLALHLPCNWRPQNGIMNKAERAERTPPVLPLGGVVCGWAMSMTSSVGTTRSPFCRHQLPPLPGLIECDKIVSHHRFLREI